ncbi:Fur family transcriptional regulator [Flavivirga algicola]|uniref:Transcriptional repressor n=1 Tax=Flavivirga algicola TaxID=2729136 RepID=A0ABX1S335_9FLAO|nr:transcriptional repressor [Flavivirga algicola]NMH89062.1 transcriptional repressor [Flavivirga algicola]
MNIQKHIEELLESHGLKKTSARIEMLKIFMDYDYALSAKEVISHMKITHDRVTIYRTLSSFEEHGILHKASEDSHGIRYALCSHECPEETHTDEHVHIICDKCSQTYCLDDVKIPKIQVLEKFLVQKISYTINGICHACLSS